MNFHKTENLVFTGLVDHVLATAPETTWYQLLDYVSSPQFETFSIPAANFLQQPNM